MPQCTTLLACNVGEIVGNVRCRNGRLLSIGDNGSTRVPLRRWSGLLLHDRAARSTAFPLPRAQAESFMCHRLETIQCFDINSARRCLNPWPCLRRRGFSPGHFSIIGFAA